MTHSESDTAAAFISRGQALAARGKLADAETAYAQAVARDPRSAEALYYLGNALYAQNKHAAAAARYREAVAVRPGFVEALYNLGNVLKDLGAADEACGCYEQVIELRPDFAEAHNNLGYIYQDESRLEEAAVQYRQAVALKPDMAEAHGNLGVVLQRQGKFDEARIACDRALTLRPDLAEAHYNLGNILREQGEVEAALAAYARALVRRPSFAEAHSDLGNLLKQQGRFPDALKHCRRAVELKPDLADAHLALGGVLLLRGEESEAFAAFRKAHELRPVNCRPAAGRADFSVVLLTAPGALNTPSDYLIGRANYDSCFVMVLSGANYDLAALRARAGVVVNLISDVDRSRVALSLAADLADRLGRPIVNHPRAILATGRDEIAERLAGIPRCRIPRTLRVEGAALAADAPKVLGEISHPLLLRLSGSHGGDDFEKFFSNEQVAAVARRAPDAEFYVSEYIPYESADRLFRKYRFIVIAGEIYPYHLAIAKQWKVHYFRTDMATEGWMRKEEEAFMREPARVFGPEQWDALRAIAAAIDLDYFGIDCALDTKGNVVVFEVNATMLVHDKKAAFAYKTPYIARIKQAFDAMLARKSATA